MDATSRRSSAFFSKITVPVAVSARIADGVVSVIGVPDSRGCAACAVGRKIISIQHVSAQSRLPVCIACSSSKMRVCPHCIGGSRRLCRGISPLRRRQGGFPIAPLTPSVPKLSGFAHVGSDRRCMPFGNNVKRAPRRLSLRSARESGFTCSPSGARPAQSGA